MEAGFVFFRPATVLTPIINVEVIGIEKYVSYTAARVVFMVCESSARVAIMSVKKLPRNWCHVASTIGGFQKRHVAQIKLVAVSSQTVTRFEMGG